MREMLERLSQRKLDTLDSLPPDTAGQLHLDGDAAVDGDDGPGHEPGLAVVAGGIREAGHVVPVLIAPGLNRPAGHRIADRGEGAAKLHALVARVQSVIEQQQDPLTTAEALATAATDALERDPWVQFERAAQRLLGAASVAASSAAGVGPLLPFPPA